jgi:hypothetical protein
MEPQTENTNTQSPVAVDPEARKAAMRERLALAQRVRAEKAAVRFDADMAAVRDALQAKGPTTISTIVAACGGLSAARVAKALGVLVASNQVTERALTDEERAAHNAGKRGRKPTKMFSLA